MLLLLAQFEKTYKSGNKSFESGCRTLLAIAQRTRNTEQGSITALSDPF
jgi:hypothetical protein